MPTIFVLKIEYVGAATSHIKASVSTEEISKNEYFKKMNRKLSRSCADLSSQKINSAVHTEQQTTHKFEVKTIKLVLRE